MTDCTCAVHPPRREFARTGLYGQAVYLDQVEDDTVTDSACPYHGDSGSMVVKVPIWPPFDDKLPSQEAHDGR